MQDHELICTLTRQDRGRAWLLTGRITPAPPPIAPPLTSPSCSAWGTARRAKAYAADRWGELRWVEEPYGWSGWRITGTPEGQS